MLTRTQHAVPHACFRKEPVLFDSFRSRDFAVRFGKVCSPVRRCSACVFRTRLGPVRFGSFPELIGSGSAGSVRFLIRSRCFRMRAASPRRAPRCLRCRRRWMSGSETARHPSAPAPEARGAAWRSEQPLGSDVEICTCV